jgi:branched-chain amino acid transport system ATP-binding protein
MAALLWGLKKNPHRLRFARLGRIAQGGAGKTTVFNLISGLLVPSAAGTIDWAGRRLDGMAPFRITRSGIARTFQNIRVFREMTLIENVLVAMGDQSRDNVFRLILPLSRFRDVEQREEKTARELLSRVGLADKARLLAGTLSYGEQRRLE